MHVIGSREEGGAERLYLRLTAALADRGEEVLCVLRPSSVLVGRMAPALPRELVRMRSVFDPFARARLGSVARGFGANIVQTYLGRATRIARFAEKSGVIHVARVGAYGEAKAVRHAHAWLASTEGIRRHLIEAGLPSQRVFHVPHLVEDACPAPPGENRAQRRAALGLDPSCAVVLCLGRLHLDRGVDLMLEAMARLPASLGGRSLRVLVVGDGPQREPLKAQARKLGIEQRVCWVPGEATPQPYMDLADLFVYPSRSAAVGSGILEAWNHGVPVVATRTAAGNELLGPGDRGVLVDVEDVCGLSAAVRQSLLAPPEQRERVVANARRVVNSAHTADAVVARCLEAYAALTR